MGIDACMLIKVPRVVDKAEALQIAVNAYERFGDALFVIKDGEGKRHCVTVQEEYSQDGDTIYPEPGQTLLEVHLWGRYYGEGYERGPLHTYIVLAEYFEQAIEGATVYYGGDSSGICADPFDKAARDKIFSYFVKFGHRPYQEFFDHDADGHICDLCNTKVIRNGWGGNYKAWFCPGCGREWEERDGIMKERKPIE